MLDGRELDPAELGMGRGWGNATKVGRDVTAELLARELGGATAVVGLLASSPHANATLTALLAELGVRAVAPADAGARPLIVAVDAELTLQLAFELGIAVGAERGRAVVVQLGDGDPPLPTGIEVLRLDPGDPGSSAKLAERLRATR